MQGWQYGKGLTYLRPIFRLTKLAFLGARATLKENTITDGSSDLNLNLHKRLTIK